MSVFQWPVRVYYEDTDAGGVVYHSNYLKFFERARTEMLRSWGFELDELTAHDGVIFAVRTAQVEYIKPARFNEALTVHTTTTQVKNASLIFEQTLTRTDNTTVLCTAIIRIACIDANALRPKAIPDKLLEKFKQ